MLKPETTMNELEPVLNLLEERLINDRMFRKTFFNNPAESINNIGIKPSPALVKFLTDFDWPEIATDVEKFNEKLVLCSSSGN